MRATRGRKNSRINYKIKTIAEKLNCSYGSVQRALCKLENDLIIYIKRTGRSSLYYFVPLNDDGTPDENSGEYQTAKALLAQKKGNSDLAKKQLTNNSNETKIPTRDFLSPAEKQRAAKRAALLSMVPKGLKISLAVLNLWINVALKYFADDAEKVFELTFQGDNPRAYFWKVYKTKILDIKKRQSQKKPSSIQNPPPNPQKSLAFKEQIEKDKRIENSIEDYINSLSYNEKFELYNEMKLRFNNFQKNRTNIMYLEFESSHEKLFQNRIVGQYIENEKLK